MSSGTRFHVTLHAQADKTRHRIDSSTLYCTPATGPHGFHTLGRAIESTLRSFNNLLERLHASYFFYLLPRPGKFIPVGHYLPAAILLGTSVTLGGFDCPLPLDGLLQLVPSLLVSLVSWHLGSTLYGLAILVLGRIPTASRRSAISLLHLYYGALIPTLAMVNFPQAILLASIVILYLRYPLAAAVVQPAFAELIVWERGNMTWPAVFAVWLPLWCTMWRL